MRYLLLFMFLVAIFVVGRRSFPFSVRIKAEGPVKTETRPNSDFHAVRMDISGTVEVRTADTYSVTVHAQESILPKIKTEVRAGELHIYIDGMVWTDEEMRFEVAGPAFDAFTLAGSGAIQVLSPIKADKLKLDLSGSGDITVSQLESASIDAGISGSGSIRMTGSTSQLFARINGSGDILAGALSADELNADISGSGSLRCKVTKVIQGSISGSGDILYTGDAREEVKVSGSGNVERMSGSGQ